MRRVYLQIFEYFGIIRSPKNLNYFIKGHDSFGRNFMR